MARQRLVLCSLWLVSIAILLAFRCAAEDEAQWPMTVKRKSPAVCGEKKDTSVRAVIEDFVSKEEVAWLKEIVSRGMAPFKRIGGPTITDPDTGYVLGPGGKIEKIKEAFTEKELERYGEMLQRVYDKVIEVHGLGSNVLFHTAPTFIARLTAFAPGRGPTVPHDEYWHLHCDKNNTDHYDYSALVYLSSHGEDFKGGLFEFHDDDGVVRRIKPKAGSLLTFSSGIENPHRVTKVTEGERMAWSLWFTCDSSKRFVNSRLKVKPSEKKEEL